MNGKTQGRRRLGDFLFTQQKSPSPLGFSPFEEVGGRMEEEGKGGGKMFEKR
jgi:hypothetical protein